MPVWMMANSSPPSARDGVGVAHAVAQPLGHHLEQLVADRMAERVVDALEVVEIEIEHRQAARRGRRRPAPRSSRSRNSTRLGRSVSASWRAICAICCSARRRSVMSSWVATQPPSAIGWLSMAMVRPSGSSTSFAMVVPASNASRASRVMYSSMSPANVPLALRCSSRSRKRACRACTTSARQAVHLDDSARCRSPAAASPSNISSACDMLLTAASKRRFCACSCASRSRSAAVRSSTSCSRPRLSSSSSSIISEIERSVRRRSRSACS